MGIHTSEFRPTARSRQRKRTALRPSDRTGRARLDQLRDRSGVDQTARGIRRYSPRPRYQICEAAMTDELQRLKAKANGPCRRRTLVRPFPPPAQTRRQLRRRGGNPPPRQPANPPRPVVPPAEDYNQVDEVPEDDDPPNDGNHLLGWAQEPTGRRQEIDRRTGRTYAIQTGSSTGRRREFRPHTRPIGKPIGVRAARTPARPSGRTAPGARPSPSPQACPQARQTLLLPLTSPRTACRSAATILCSSFRETK